MKIKTITCHHVYNYGASLQAYALQNYLESLGNDVEIIDYRLPVHIRYELFTPYPHGITYDLIKKIPFLRYIITPIKNRDMFKTWGRKKAFDEFDKSFLHISPQTYRSIEELQAANIDAELLIAGSDQIWNPEMLNGHDKGYYLDFGPRNCKRISYAASFGVEKIDEKQEDFIRKQLNKISSISVREKTGLKILNNIGCSGVQVLDPVFLLSKEEWIKKLGLIENEKNYILVYDFLHDNEEMKNIALELAKETDLKIISINDYSKNPYADIQINNAGPKEFLQLILGAKYVVSCSFHATAFSIIFNKKFATYPLHNLNNSSRMVDLLNEINLKERFKSTSVKEIQKSINWADVNQRISTHISLSKKFLLSNLKNNL